MAIVGEPDWEPLIVDSPDRTMTRKVLNYSNDSYPSGWIGRQLLRLFKQAGLEDIIIVPRPIILTDFGMADQLFVFTKTVAKMQAEGQLTSGEAAEWLGWLREADRAGHFFSAVIGIDVGGRKAS